MRDSISSRSLLARLADLGIYCGVLLLALIAVLVVSQVVARNFFNLGLPWADELARFSGIGLVFLSVPCLAARKVLVSVSMLPDALSTGAQRWTTLIADLATLAFSGFMLWGFAEFLPRAGKFLTPAMGLPNWFYYSFALLGTLLLFAIACHRTVAALQGRDPGAPYHDPSDDNGLPV